MCQEEIWNDSIEWKEMLLKELHVRDKPEFLVLSNNTVLRAVLTS